MLRRDLSSMPSQWRFVPYTHSLFCPLFPHYEKQLHDTEGLTISRMFYTRRKELQHMLHTRRKAEIEILSTAKPLPPPAQEMPKWSSSVSGAPPLLEYLLEKILAFVDACADA